MTAPAFLQGTQATAKPNTPKKKFQGKTRKVLNHSGVVEEMLNAKDSADLVQEDRRFRAKSKDKGGNIDLSTRDPRNSPDETDDDNDGKAIHALIGDTQAGDSKGARDRYIDYMVSQAGKSPPKKRFAGKPKEKK